MSQNNIARAENPFDFFHASVNAAANRVGSPVSEAGLSWRAEEERRAAWTASGAS